MERRKAAVTQEHKAEVDAAKAAFEKAKAKFDTNEKENNEASAKLRDETVRVDKQQQEQQHLLLPKHVEMATIAIGIGFLFACICPLPPPPSIIAFLLWLFAICNATIHLFSLDC